MEKRNRNVMILSIVALAIVIITASYAYFSARITGLENASTISMTAGRMGIEYSEGDENVIVQNIYPRNDAWITKTFSLTGYNTTTQNMSYDLGIQIDTNTFKGGQLTFDLTGVGENGTKIADITGKSITGQNRFFKIGTGSFSASDGDTHVYTLKIYFKDNGKDQNINQGAIFNGKISVKDSASAILSNNCTYDGELVQDAEYVNGQYTYKYIESTGTDPSGLNLGVSGWGVSLTDKESTDPVTSKLCTSINNEPIISTAGMFADSQATSIDLSSFDTSNVINMFSMFRSAAANNLDLSSFDTSSVVYMRSMFAESQATTLDLSSLDTSNVTDMYNMFRYSQATSLDLSSFDTSSVVYMSCMFYRSQATNINLDSFDTSNVTDMSVMFQGSQATNIDLSSFDTSNVTNMESMFRESQATSIDLSNFDTSNVTNMGYMFDQSVATSLDLSSFDTSKVTDMSGMFGHGKVTNLDLSHFDTSKVSNMSRMFEGSSSLTTIYVSSRFVFTNILADDYDHELGSIYMFKGATNLVGGAGTTYNSSKTNKEYARIDGGTSNPGYFTAK